MSHKIRIDDTLCGTTSDKMMVFYVGHHPTKSVLYVGQCPTKLEMMTLYVGQRPTR